MSASTLVVYLDGVRCGDLEQSDGGDLTFTYAPEYLGLRNRTPLSLSMPAAVSVHRKKQVRPFLEGLMTDNDQARAAEGRRYGVSPQNPFALLRHVGRDVAGALQILPPGVTPTDGIPGGHPVPIDETAVATMLSHVVSEYEDGTPYFDQPGLFSLAGAQPKIALHRLADGTWTRSTGALPTTHILKPVAGSLRRVDVVEQMTLHAAGYVGNEVATTQLERIGTWDVLVSTRYDRQERADGWRRIHQEDLCQSLSVAPAKKYQDRDGGPGVGRIAQLLKTLPRLQDRRLVGEKFFRALVFNVVAGCTDAHAKNYSLLLEGDTVQLAPLYDLLTYAAYWDGRMPLRSAMSIGGEYSLGRISSESLAAEGKRLGVAADDARAIVETTRSSLVEAFESAHTEIAHLGPSARSVGDDLLRGLKQLPLLAN